MIVLNDCPKCTQPVYALAEGARAPLQAPGNDDSLYWHRGCAEDEKHERRRDRSSY